jgi:hypothetical protein
VAILNIKSGPGLYSFGRFERADGKLIIVAVAIHNGQNTAITMNTSLFKIVDSNGNVYSTSEKSIEIDHDLFLAQINPGITKTGQIVFDVPENLSMDNLWLRFRGGMTGDSATVALKVNSTVMRASAPPETTAPISENMSPSAEGARPNPGDDNSANLEFMVQIAAFSHKEDADVLVGALHRRGYAVTVSRDSTDYQFHVQVGPFTSHNDANTMRQKLLNDGYNAIVSSENTNPGTSSITSAQTSNQSTAADNAQRVSSKVVTRGQTPEEVESILGPPITVTIGPRRIYSYPHMKVFFLEGKVAAIQQF